MKLTRFRYNKMACAVAVIGTVSALAAGDLNPPPGPVGPTGRFGPRTEISDTKTPGDADSLFKITQPGSYYLTGNITGVSGKSGIEIAASGVTLDLNGFAMIGIPGSLHGIVRGPAGHFNLTVYNGTVTLWGQSGLELLGGGLLLENLHVLGNVGTGIFSQSTAVISKCTILENGGFGINGSHANAIRNCQIARNGSHGVRGGSGFMVSNCQVSDNAGDGIHLIAGSGDGNGAVSVTESTIRRNGGIGINLATSGIVTGCVSNNNGSVGIQAIDSLVQGNTATNYVGANISTTTSTVLDNHAP